MLQKQALKRTKQQIHRWTERANEGSQWKGLMAHEKLKQNFLLTGMLESVRSPTFEQLIYSSELPKVKKHILPEKHEMLDVRAQLLRRGHYFWWIRNRVIET